MGGGQSKNSQQLRNTFESLTETVTSTFLEVRTACVQDITVSQLISLGNVGGNLNIDGVTQDATVKAYTQCEQDNKLLQDFSNQFKTDLSQKLEEKKDAFFDVFNKAIEALGDTAAIALGGKLEKETIMENSTSLKNKIVNDLNQNFIQESFNNIKTKQEIIVGDIAGDANIKNVVQKANVEAVMESAMKTDIMQKLSNVVETTVSQEAAKKSSFGLFDMLQNGYLLMAIVIIALVGGGIFMVTRLKGDSKNS